MVYTIMKYWCNICKKEITKKVFEYSMDFFGKPLCLYHQDIERKKNKIKHNSTNKSDFSILNNNKVFNFLPKEFISQNKSKIKKWKKKILFRLSKFQIKKICWNNNIKADYNINDRKELISKIVKKLSFKSILFYINIWNINIKDITGEIEDYLIKWKINQLEKKTKQNKNNNLLLDVERTIYKFKPFRKYKYEFEYQDTLASFIKAKYPDTKIEVSSNSTRPDIYVNGIAIEVKGPTFETDLQTIADKCIRYTQNFPNGLICVLFDIKVSENRYKDWLNGMKNNFPEIKIIRFF